MNSFVDSTDVRLDGDELAFGMAEEGDETVRSTLQLIVARDANPAKRQRAEELLEELDRPPA